MKRHYSMETIESLYLSTLTFFIMNLFNITSYSVLFAHKKTKR